MIWTGRTDEAAALGLLLDRTYADAAAAAAHPRLLDREFLIGQFDLWDNHLLPAFAAAYAPLWTRRSAARAVWRRLGFAAGAEHRRWLADHLDGLGHDPVALLGPERADHLPFRGGDGDLRPVDQPLTQHVAELIQADYAFVGGAVAGARMEARGSDPVRIEANLKLSAGTRRYTEEAAPPPVLWFHAPAATSFVFPHAGPGSASLTRQPSFVVTPDEASIDGPGVRLAGPPPTWYPDDSRWHESAMARAAETGELEQPPVAPEAESPPAGPVDLLSTLQLMIMVQLRMMRHAGKLRRWELAAAAALCGGTGAELFRVGPAFLRERAAARRLRTMVATDDDLARAFLRHVGRRVSLDVPDPPGAAAPPAPARITVGTAGRLLADLDFTGARLRFVDVKPEQTVIHLDARHSSRDTLDARHSGRDTLEARHSSRDTPDARHSSRDTPDARHGSRGTPDARHSGGRDTIVVIVLTEPLGCAPLTVTPDGLELTRPPTLEATADDISLTIPLPGGDWTPSAAAGSWYVD